MKTVNAWFQNKRASTKKRSNKGGSSNGSSNVANAQCELPPISALIATVSAPSSHAEYEESDDEQLAPFLDRPPMSSSQHSRQQSAFYAGNPQHRHLFESESASARKGRSRPSVSQTEELRKLYDVNPHPSKEEREDLGVRIGM